MRRAQTSASNRPTLLALFGLFFLPLSVKAAFDCHLSLGSRSFDLNPLSGVHHFETSTPTPPTVTKIVYTLSICSPLPIPSPPTDDDCPEGTRICQTTLTTRAGLEDRVISVVPIAGDIGKGAFEVVAADTDGEAAAKGGWRLEISGGSYNEVPQKARVEMRCEKGAKETAPQFTSYDPLQGLLTLTWQTEYACANEGENPPPGKGKEDEGDGDKDGDGKKEPSADGLGFFGWFFTLLFLSLAVYFAAGVYYNYTQYGSTGWDMVPHRDVWRDLPYVLQDLFKGRGASRSGYSALG